MDREAENRDLKKDLWLIFGVAAVTIGIGFFAWWTFVIVAFAAGFYFKFRKLKGNPALPASVGTSLGWLMTALVRDISESGRASTKLAMLFHVNSSFDRHLHLAIGIYAALYFMIFIPSCFAAVSGAQLSKAFR